MRISFLREIKQKRKKGTKTEEAPKKRWASDNTLLFRSNPKEGKKKKRLIPCSVANGLTCAMHYWESNPPVWGFAPRFTDLCISEAFYFATLQGTKLFFLLTVHKQRRRCEPMRSALHRGSVPVTRINSFNRLIGLPTSILIAKRALDHFMRFFWIRRI